jgi:prevent-host-death family protein
MEVNIHQAKTNLSRLILRAEAGEEVVIARAGKPAVRLVPVQAPAARKFKFGALKGRLVVPGNFLDPAPELESLFYDGSIFPDSAEPEIAAARRKPPSRGKPASGMKGAAKAAAPQPRARSAR